MAPTWILATIEMASARFLFFPIICQSAELGMLSLGAEVPAMSRTDHADVFAQI